MEVKCLADLSVLNLEIIIFFIKLRKNCYYSEKAFIIVNMSVHQKVLFIYCTRRILRIF
jgi:hypothetical protein